jgi:hypothetical protein
MIRALTALGELARVQSDLESARRYYEEGLVLATESGGRYQEALQYNNLSFVAYHQKDYHLSMHLMKQSLTILREMDFKDVSTCLFGLAGPIAALGYPERAAQLIGAADTQQEISGVPFQSPDQQDVLPILEAVRQTLNEKAFQEAWQAGRAMTIQDTFSYSLSELEPREQS